MQLSWPLITFSEAPSIVDKSLCSTWLSEAAKIIFVETASYSSIFDEVRVELMNSSPLLRNHIRTSL